MIIAVIPILSGLIITLGVITLTVGRLNLISSAMIAVLFGIGIDFGIYLIQRTEEELGNGLTLEQAAYRSVVETSQSIVTGGFTTSLAFLAIGFSSFKGFSELGITAGIGILIMLITTFMFLPALIINVGVEPKKYDVHGIMAAAKTIHKKKPLIAFGVVTILLTLFSVFSIFKIKMDYNALKLLPRNTESTIYQVKMEETSDYKMSSAAVTSKSLDELTKMTAQIKTLPTVSRVDSLAELIPDNQAEKIKIMQQYREILGGINLTYIPSNLSAAEYSMVIKGMIEFFENFQEKAFAGGMKDIEDKIDKLLVTLNALNDEFTGSNSANAVARTNDFDKTLFSKVNVFNMLIKAWLNPEPMSEKNLPDAFVNRFKSSKGTYVAYIFPNGPIWEVDFLDKFVNGIRNITPEVTGFPVTHRVYVRQAASAIIESMFYSLAMVILLLWIEFRSFRIVGIAFIPLALGMIWMQSVVYIIGMPYNVANIACLPLLFGLGVVYGVRIVHRWLENPKETAFIATRTTGKGVFFAASATLIALFSIIFARHYGMSSFGVVLFIGLSFCLVAALFVLPVLIDLLYLDKEKKK
jgi:predicted RND superfamily exporter protein